MQELLAFTPKDYWVRLISMLNPTIPSYEGYLRLVLDTTFLKIFVVYRSNMAYVGNIAQPKFYGHRFTDNILPRLP